MTAHTADYTSCAHVIQSVWDYLDDEIDTDRKQRIRRHLEMCDHCRDLYTFELSFLDAVSLILDDDAHVESLRRRVEAALIEHGFSRPT